MLQKYRSKEEIIYTILGELVIQPLAKTKIMYRSNLCFKQLNCYIKLMLEKELIENIGKQEVEYEGNKVMTRRLELFKITEKGLLFIKRYQLVDALM